MTKAFGKPNPLTLTERKHILRFNAQGLSVASIRRELGALGFRRGDDFIRTFLRSNDFPPNFTTGIPRPPNFTTGIPRPRLRQSHDDSPSCDHECAFCSWRGSYSHYYEHWRTNHRTRAGVTRRELEKARHAP